MRARLTFLIGIIIGICICLTWGLVSRELTVAGQVKYPEIGRRIVESAKSIVYSPVEARDLEETDEYVGRAYELAEPYMMAFAKQRGNRFSIGNCEMNVIHRGNRVNIIFRNNIVITRQKGRAFREVLETDVTVRLQPQVTRLSLEQAIRRN